MNFLCMEFEERLKKEQNDEHLSVDDRHVPISTDTVLLLTFVTTNGYDIFMTPSTESGRERALRGSLLTTPTQTQFLPKTLVNLFFF